MSLVELHLQDSPVDRVFTEACHCLINLVDKSTPDERIQLIEKNHFIRTFYELLDTVYRLGKGKNELIIELLTQLDNLLSCQSHFPCDGISGPVYEFSELNGEELLEDISSQTTDTNLFTETDKIIKKYYKNQEFEGTTDSTYNKAGEMILKF